MKKQFLLFSFIFSFFCLNAQILQQKIFIDFGPNGTGTGNYLNGVITPSPDANLNYWNNAINPVAPASLSLVNSSNVSTGFNMAVTTTMNLNGLAANGGLASPSATSLGDLAIGTATQDFFFTNNATSPGALKFTNLNPAKGYKFYILGSRATTAEIRTTKYTLTGVNSMNGTLQTSGSTLGGTGGNVSQIFTSTLIYPNNSGEILLDISTVSGSYGYINDMKIEEYTAPFVNVTGITVSGVNISTAAGTTQLSGTVSPVNASITDFTWSVNDLTIATISSTGLLTALKNGTVTVTATTKEPNSSVSGSTQIAISNQQTRFPITLKIIDQTKSITNGTGSNAGMNVIAAISATLQAQNPRNPSPTDWWYPMYADPTYSPKGTFTNNTTDYTWETTLYATPGTYTWTPYLKSTGWTYLNNTYIYSTTPVITFTVNADGSVTGMTQLVIPNVKYKIRLKVVDRSKGALSSSIVYPDNNVVAWLSAGLNTTTSWFYGFYSGDTMYPNGNLIKSDTAWVWQATFDAPPGVYQWNPSMKSLGTSAANPVTINGNVSTVSWVGSNLSFTVGQTGVLTGDTVLMMAEDPLNPILKTYLTLNVDMKGITVDPAGVFVTGTFNNWSSTATQMTDPEGDGIYTKKIEVTKSNTPYEYKFINGNTFGNVENVFGECEFRSNRIMLVDTGSVVVPAVAYGYCGAIPAEITKIKVACVGSSTTQGAGTSNQIYKSWPVQIRADLGSAYYTENLGVSGTTLQSITGQAWKETNQYTYTKMLNPNIVLMALGGNDTKLPNWDPVRFRADYLSLIAEFKAMPTHPEVYMCMPGKIRPNTYGLNDSVMINYELPIVREISKTFMIPVIDYNTVTSPILMAPLFPDGVHGNDDGAKLIADKIAEVFLTAKPVISIENATSNADRTFYEHRWYLNGTLIDNSNTNSYSATQSGIYNVAVKTSATEDHVLISQPMNVVVSNGGILRLTTKTTTTAVSNSLDAKPIIYCDADARKLIVERAQDSKIKIYTINGILVRDFDIQGNTASFDLSDLTKGIYLCKLELKTRVMTSKVLL